MKFYKILTYGCQMNVHDSERIAGGLEYMGLTACAQQDEADVIVLNTCCIRDTAEQKIFGNIGEIKHIKKKNPEKIVAVVGCLTQQEGAAARLKEHYPFVDIVLGTSNSHLLSQKIEELLAKAQKRRPHIIDIPEETVPEIAEDCKPFRTSYPNAWVNIMYGCNNFCTYCIVPYVRGRERSRDFSAILAECESLLAEGYKEITLLGQNVNSYSAGGKDFAALISAIAALPYKFRLRFMTSHPKDLSAGVIEAVKNHPNIAKNIHLPVQAGSDAVLSAMNRRYTRAHYLSLLKDIRTAMPDCGITTDIMVGFPNETEDDFYETLALVREAQFSNAFTFVYSPRKGTSAAKMEQLSARTKKERITRLVALQNEITKALSLTYVGKTFEVLAEDMPKPGILCGRTDSGRLVSFPGEATQVGEFLQVYIEKSKSASLWGRMA